MDKEKDGWMDSYKEKREGGRGQKGKKRGEKEG